MQAKRGVAGGGRTSDAAQHHPRPRRPRLTAIGILAGLGVSALSIAVAPALIPASYSWVEQTTSESAAQGVPGAWLARLGFVVFGLSVLWLTRLAERRWGRWGTALHTAFGVLMIATAAFSHRPWEPQATFDPTEDLLHSIAATAMGFALAFGVIVVMRRRAGSARRARTLDVIAVATAVLLPLSMSLWPGYAGLLQRLMFLIGYLWYGAEAVRSMSEQAAPVTGSRHLD